MLDIACFILTQVIQHLYDLSKVPLKLGYRLFLAGQFGPRAHLSRTQLFRAQFANNPPNFYPKNDYQATVAAAAALMVNMASSSPILRLPNLDKVNIIWSSNIK